MHTRPDGYVVVRISGHPLAWGSTNIVYEHRVVAFEAWGPGSQRCFGCGREVFWDQHPTLCVDHVDDDKANNAIENLQPSCRGCNRWKALRLLRRVA